MSTNNRVVLELMHGLASALSHRIRSPLSAISNELFCLKTRSPAPEHDQIKDRCQDIVALLGQSCALGYEPLQSSAFSLRTLLAEVFGEPALRIGPNAFALGDSVRGDRNRLRTALQGIRDAFTLAVGTGEDSALGITANVTLAFKKFALTIASPAEIGEEVRNQPAAATLTRFFNAQLGIDSLGSILADAVLFAHNVPVHVDAKNGLRVSFELPRNEE